MPLYRGGIYRATGLSDRTFGLLVLTRDAWNESGLASVVVAPVGPVLDPRGPAAPLVMLGPRQDAQVRLGDVFEAPKSALGDLRYVLEPRAMEPVEDGVCDLLVLADLCQDPPRAPRPPAGAPQGPQWAESYYVLGDEYAGERKRRVVVSHDWFNRAAGRALAVRTTTSERRGGPGFPPVQGGRPRAVCGSLTSFLRDDFGRQRPDPPRLFLPDMAVIARDLVDVLDLEAALERARGRA